MMGSAVYHGILPHCGRERAVVGRNVRICAATSPASAGINRAANDGSGSGLPFHLSAARPGSVRDRERTLLPWSADAQKARPAGHQPPGTMRQIAETASGLAPFRCEPDEDAREVLDRQLPLLYDQLKRIAQRQLRHERAGHTLNPTALVHEAYLKLADQTRIELQDRAHLLALTAAMMRRILVDHARRRKAGKRGGEWIRTTLSGKARRVETDPEELLALDAAMEQLDARQRQVVELRFFTGMTEAEIGEILDVSERTVRRDWVKARAWLYSELYPES
jgi:RNA polymerase sigma-70 factor, ECF subfamily